MNNNLHFPSLRVYLIISSLTVFCSSQTVCTEDLCLNGFCNLVDNEPSCSCVVGYDGELCEIEMEVFSDLSCENGIAKWVDLNVAACACSDGWGGETCSELIEDYDVCTDVECNGQGSCIVTETDNALCMCSDGYSGDQCQHEETSCGFEYLMDISAIVYDSDTNAGLDCSYFIGLLWSDMAANSVTGYPGLCTCIDVLLTNMTTWANNIGCIVEEDFPMKLYSMNQLHCNHCTDDEITDMKAVLQNISESCDMFITYRDVMPLYWRTPLKCVCLGSLGDTREEVAELVYCPFTTHAARTDLTAYDNCYNDDVEICDFTYVKHSLEIHLKGRSPSGFETCTSAMIDLFEMIPSGGFFANLPDDWCPCYETIAAYWSDGLDVLDCHAVTFYEFTIKDLFLLYCNDEAFLNKDDLWSVAKIATVASYYDYTTAAACSNFVMYGGALTENATDSSLARAETLFCSCLTGLETIRDDNDFYEHNDPASISWSSFVPDQFADGLLEMEDLLALFPNKLADLTFESCDPLTTAGKDDDDSYQSYSQSEDRHFIFSFSTSTTTDTYITVNIALGIACALLFVTNFYYCLNDRTHAQKPALPTPDPVRP